MEKRVVYIVSAVRTALGSFGGSLSTVLAPKLGAAAIKGALEKIKLNPAEVQEVFMGNVLQANVGQAPARQAARYAGIPDYVPCTTINKVCASGMKSIMIGAQSILLGDNDVVVAGGMENMSITPYYVESNRWGAKFGNTTLIDGIQKDGLLDAYDGKIMGSCAEVCAADMKISREEQDDFAIMSYQRSAESWAKGKFKDEVVPVEVQTKKGSVVFAEDEEYKNVNFEKLRQLKPAFEKNGTVTAANASTINDGAAAVILMSKEKAEKSGIKPLAIIRSYADAEQEPTWFTTTPSKAMPKAAEKAGLKISDIDYFEINEAFSVVALANARILDIPLNKLNVNGGAASLGHPLGASGARIIVTLINVLKQNNARFGLAGICNGGGGASALLIENMQ